LHAINGTENTMVSKGHAFFCFVVFNASQSIRISNAASFLKKIEIKLT
jgi:hypothetical protein